jgi:hypothetical protein
LEVDGGGKGKGESKSKSKSKSKRYDLSALSLSADSYELKAEAEAEAEATATQKQIPYGNDNKSTENLLACWVLRLGDVKIYLFMAKPIDMARLRPNNRSISKRGSELKPTPSDPCYLPLLFMRVERKFEMAAAPCGGFSIPGLTVLHAAHEST